MSKVVFVAIVFAAGASVSIASIVIAIERFARKSQHEAPVQKKVSAK